MNKGKRKKVDFDVDQVAGLARIELTKKEERDFGSQLQKVLGYFDTLEGVRSQKLEDRIKHRRKKTVLRDDKLMKCLPREEALKNAPAAEHGFIKVKAVFGNNE